MTPVIAATVEVDTLLWVAGLLLAIIGFLIVLIARFFHNSIVDLRSDCAELNKKLEEERKERTNKHDDSIKRVFDEIEKVKEKNSDLSETVAGIGSVYITRNEFHKK